MLTEQENSPLLRVSFHCIMSVSRILYRAPVLVLGDRHLSSPSITLGVKRHSQLFPKKGLGTALHQSKDFAVSPSILLSKLAQLFPKKGLGGCSLSLTTVTARTSLITQGGRYPLPFPALF